MMQAAAREATAGGSRGGVRIQRTIRLDSRSSDPAIQTALRRTQDSSDIWFENYVNAYLDSADFRRDLERTQDRITQSGWTITSLRPVDNVQQGVLFEVTVERGVGAGVATV